MPNELKVEIVGDTRDLDRAMGRAQKSTQSFGKSLLSMGKMGALGAGAAGLGLVTVGLTKSIKAAQESEQAQARLEQALGSANVSYETHGRAIDSAIQKTSRLAALDDEELSDAFAKLVRSTGDVTQATEGMNLAADIARARNISLEAATKVVEKGLMGNAAAFKKVGVEVDKGTTATEAFEKAQEQFAGAAKRHGDTAAGAQEKLSIAFENLQEKIGQKLLPVIAKLATKLVDLIEWTETNWPKFKEAMEPVINAAKLLVNNFIDRIEAIAAAVKGIIKIIQGIKNGDWTLVWEGIKQVVVDGAGGMVKAMVALPAKILAALGEKAWDGLEKVGGYIKGKILAGLNGLVAGVASAVIGAVNSAIGLLNRAIDAYNAIPLLPNVGHVGSIAVPTSSSPPSGLSSYPDKRASGGPVSAGVPYLVGEAGPELFMPGASGAIVPNDALGGRSGPIVVHNHLTIELDGRELTTRVRAHLMREARHLTSSSVLPEFGGRLGLT